MYARIGFDPMSPMKEGPENEQSPGQNEVLSFFRDDRYVHITDVGLFYRSLLMYIGLFLCVLF